MKTLLPVFLVIMLSCFTASAQKLAQFSTGQRGTAAFELFKFYADGKIYYAYGADEKEYALKYMGKAKCNNEKNCFTVSFPSGKTYNVASGTKNTITVDGVNIKYHKMLTWLYEGPVNGRGTYCTSCADGPEEAIKIVTARYLK